MSIQKQRKMDKSFGAMHPFSAAYYLLWQSDRKKEEISKAEGFSIVVYAWPDNSCAVLPKRTINQIIRTLTDNEFMPYTVKPNNKKVSNQIYYASDFVWISNLGASPSPDTLRRCVDDINKFIQQHGEEPHIGLSVAIATTPYAASQMARKAAHQNKSGVICDPTVTQRINSLHSTTEHDRNTLADDYKEFHDFCGEHKILIDQKRVGGWDMWVVESALEAFPDAASYAATYPTHNLRSAYLVGLQEDYRLEAERHNNEVPDVLAEKLFGGTPSEDNIKRYVEDRANKRVLRTRVKEILELREEEWKEIREKRSGPNNDQSMGR